MSIAQRNSSIYYHNSSESSVLSLENTNQTELTKYVMPSNRFHSDSSFKNCFVVDNMNINNNYSNKIHTIQSNTCNNSSPVMYNKPAFMTMSSQHTINGDISIMPQEIEPKSSYVPKVRTRQPNGSSTRRKPKSTFPFGKCKVCTDKATGIHYGIATCEGCKVLFVIYRQTFHLHHHHQHLNQMKCIKPRAFSNEVLLNPKSTSVFLKTPVRSTL